MKEKLTVEWLKGHNACEESIIEYKELGEQSIEKVFAELKKRKNYDWLNWLLSRLLDKTQCVEYAIYAAEQVIDNFEKVYPNDKRPRQAIEAAKNYLENPGAASAAIAASWSATSWNAESAASAILEKCFEYGRKLLDTEKGGVV